MFSSSFPSLSHLMRWWWGCIAAFCFGACEASTKQEELFLHFLNGGKLNSWIHLHRPISCPTRLTSNFSSNLSPMENFWADKWEAFFDGGLPVSCMVAKNTSIDKNRENSTLKLDSSWIQFAAGAFWGAPELQKMRCMHQDYLSNALSWNRWATNQQTSSTHSQPK